MYKGEINNLIETTLTFHHKGRPHYPESRENGESQ